MTTSIPLRVFFATSALKKRLGKRRELMERTTKVFPLDDTPKALKNQGFSGKPFQSGHSFSSQARYDHFDTPPWEIYSVFGTDNMVSSRSRYTRFDTAENHLQDMLPHIHENVKRQRNSRQIAA
jgi:hypothetical protein